MKRLMIALVALAGCSTDALLESAFPDRERFQFPNKDGDALLFYACAPGPDAADRARQAHAFFEQNVDALAAQAADGLIARSENGQGALGNAIALNRELNTNVEIIVEQAETRYQCLFYDDQPI